MARNETKQIGFIAKQTNRCKIAQNVIESTQIFWKWNPKVSINPKWLWNVSNWSSWCRTAPNRLEMLWNGLVSMEWLSKMEIGLEFGSAGPIWMRLLFVWPDPSLIWLCFNHKSIPTFQPAGMRLLYIIAARICNFFIFTLLFSHLILSPLSYFNNTFVPLPL